MARIILDEAAQPVGNPATGKGWIYLDNTTDPSKLYFENEVGTRFDLTDASGNFADDVFRVFAVGAPTTILALSIGGTAGFTGTFATTFTTAKTLTFPDATDVMVARDTTDTLTNKTLTQPTIADFTLATHNHTNAAGGSVLGSGALPTAYTTDTASEISGTPVKGTPVGADFLLIEDSAAANIKKHVLISSLPGGGSVPTGSGFRHVTAGVEDAASETVTFSDADQVTPNQGTVAQVLHGNVAGQPSFGAIVTADITDDNVTFPKVEDIATARILGRVTAATGNIEELTATQATTLINVFTSALKGSAPASGGGTTNFLRADGTWAAPAGGGGGDPVLINGTNVTEALGINLIQSDGVTITHAGGPTNPETATFTVDEAFTFVWTGLHTFNHASGIDVGNIQNTGAIDIAPTTQVNITGTTTHFIERTGLSTGFNNAFIMRGDFTTPAVGDQIGTTFQLENTGGGTWENFVRLAAIADNIGVGTEESRYQVSVASAGALRRMLLVDPALGTVTIGDNTNTTNLILSFDRLDANGNITWDGSNFAASAPWTLASLPSTVVDTGDTDVVSYAMIQNVVANNVFLGNNSGAGGIIDELTGTEATALLNNFTAGLKGLAPLSGGGTTNFLRADGTWVAPPSAGSLDDAYNIDRAITVDAGAVRLHNLTAGPVTFSALELERNPAAGAANDQIDIRFRFADTGGGVENHATIAAKLIVATPTSEEVDIIFRTDGGTGIRDVWTLKANGDMQMGVDGAAWQDISGNDIITLSRTASAVNSLNIKNNSTGNDVQMTVVGEANIGINLVPSGASGRIKFNNVEGVDLSLTQTLTNKTLTSPTLTTPTINGVVATTGLTLPAFTMSGTLTRAANQIIDLTGAATRTLTLQNSTGSQVADFDADGRLIFRNNTAFTMTLDGTPTAARVVTFPDATGTVAYFAGQLGGTADVPDVRGIRTTTGPTLLTILGIADGEFLKRVGSDIVGDPGGGGGDNIDVNATPANDANFGSLPAAPSVEDLNVIWQLDGAATPDNISAHIEMNNITRLGLVTIGIRQEPTVATDTINVTELSTPTRTTDGITDSPRIFQTVETFVSATPHEGDWIMYVRGDSTAGASSYLWRNRIDAAGFATKLELSDAGVLTLFGDIDIGGATRSITNGAEEILTLTDVASAVNELGITNSATGANEVGSPILIATGGDADVGIYFQAKGDDDYYFRERQTTPGNTDIRAVGASANISLRLWPKGSGSVQANGSPVVTAASSTTFTGVNVFDGASASLEVPNAAGGRTVDVAGEVTVDTTSETFNFYDGTVEAVLNPTQKTSFTLTDPVLSDLMGIWITDKAITVTKIQAICEGGTSAVLNIEFATTVTAAGTLIDQIIPTTSIVTETTLTDATVPTGQVISVNIGTVVGGVNSVTCTIWYREDA